MYPLMVFLSHQRKAVACHKSFTQWDPCSRHDLQGQVFAYHGRCQRCRSLLKSAAITIKLPGKQMLDSSQGLLLRRIPVGRELWMIFGKHPGNCRSLGTITAAALLCTTLQDATPESPRELPLCTGWLSVVNPGTTADCAVTHTVGLVAGASIVFPTPELASRSRGMRRPPDSLSCIQ